MSSTPPAPGEDPNDEISSLVRVLHETQERLRELTGGQVDAVLHQDGHSYLLHEAQGRLRDREQTQRRLVATMEAIFNALPAHIALLDEEGVILSVNESWRLFALFNDWKDPHPGLGENYVELCERASGPGAEEARRTAAGIRAVLKGETREFSLEYPCELPQKKRWFQVIVAGVDEGQPGGVVVMHIDVTGRKLAEEALRSTAESLAVSQRVAHLGSWELELNADQDVMTGPVRWSDEMYRILGYEPQTREMDARFFFQHLPPEHRTALLQGQEILRQGKQHVHIHPIIRPDGTERIVRSVAQMIFDEAGRPIKMVGTVHDITEAKATEEQLLEKTTILEAQLNSALDGIVMASSDGRKVLLQNQRAIDLWKLPPNFADEENPRRRFAIYATQVKAPEQFIARMEYLFHHPDEIGRDELEFLDGRIIDRYTAPVRGKDGKYYGKIWVYRDVTERKRSESRLRRLVDSNMQGVCFGDPMGKVTDANDAFLQMLGYTREDLNEGRIDWTTLTPPSYADLDRQAHAEIEDHGTCTPYQKEYIRKDGTRVPVLVGGASFEDNPREGVCFVLDLTAQKKLEQQFLRAQRMESIGTLAGGIAHDLNNILSPIMMAVQVLQLKTTEAQSKSILDTIEISAKRGADIVRQVLSFSRGLQGERAEVHPAHLLRDIEAIIRDTFPKNIRRETKVPEDTWTIVGDPTQLHQILLNLCVNARDAMPEGGSLSITVENARLDQQYATMNMQAKPGRYVLISVTDSGTGMPPAIVDKIFEPFFTTKELGKGTGLGLSTVLAITKSHGGFVNVYSEPGKGSNFRVYLPALEQAPGRRIDGPTLITLPRGRGERILIVDDESSILTITSQTLEAFGYRTVTAGDGAEAVAIYARQHDQIAVVLTDMAMPIMDGPATIRALQKIDPVVKIIAATGLKTEGSEARALNAGIRHFLAKPYTAETLLKTLRAILEEGPARS